MLPERIGQRTLRVVSHPSPLRQELRAFLIDRQARGLSERTVDYYAEKLRPLIAFLESQDVGTVEKVTPHLLRRFLLEQSQRRSPGGLHALYRAAKAFLRWWEAETEPEGWRNPIEKVPAPRVPQEVLDPLSLEDLKAMLATCKRRTLTGDRDHALLLALLDTGCRATEFLALNMGDLDLRSGALMVRHSKGKRPRSVFVGRATLREIVRYLRHRPDALPGEPLWATREGGRLRYFGLVSLLTRHARAARVPIPLPHSFRRAFALTCLRQGMDVISLQRLMGHRDLAILRRYLKQTEEDLRAVHERSCPVDRLLR